MSRCACPCTASAGAITRPSTSMHTAVTAAAAPTSRSTGCRVMSLLQEGGVDGPGDSQRDEVVGDEQRQPGQRFDIGCRRLGPGEQRRQPCGQHQHGKQGGPPLLAGTQAATPDVEALPWLALLVAYD